MNLLQSAILVLSAAPLCSQSVAREAASESCFISRTGVLEYEYPDYGILDDVIPAPLTVATGVPHVGDVSMWYVTVNWVSDAHYLVSGRDNAGNGVIQHWVRTGDTGPAPTLSSQHVLAGKDFISAAWDRDKNYIYALDLSAKAILRASWNGVAALPGSASWTTIATTTEVAELASADKYLVHIYKPTATTSVVRYVEHLVPGSPLLRVELPIKFIDDSTSPVTVTGQVPAVVDPGWELPGHAIAEKATLVTVTTSEGDTGVIYQLIDSGTSTILGSTVGNGTGSVVITSSSALVLGESYMVKRSTDPMVPEFGMECHARYGHPETTLDSIVIGRLYHDPDVVVGNSDYRVATHLSTENAAIIGPDHTTPIDGFIAIAAREPVSGVDPVIEVGGNHLLVTELYIPAEALLLNGEGRLSSAPISIPNDSSLIGSVILHQAYLFRSNVWSVSDIVGVLVKGASTLKSSGPPNPASLISAASPARIRSVFLRTYARRLQK